jgi:branched-chain amino acid transport system substrate-binding protein
VDFVYGDYPPTFAKNILTEIRQQEFHPKVIYNSAMYDATAISVIGDKTLAEGVLAAPGLGLFLGEDDAPGVELMNEWVKKTVPGAVVDIYTTFGWASAQLFVEALKAAGKDVTQEKLLAALKNIHQFDTQGLTPVADVGTNSPPHCFAVWQIKDGKYVRLHPAKGFDCSGTYHLEK